MGGVPYDYVVPYQEDVQAALDHLRREVFERGDYYGAEHRPSSIREALEASEDTGTRSILDIERVTPEPDYCCAAPVGEDDLQRYFGTSTPTAAHVQDSEEFWEDLERGMARYVIVYDGGKPSQIFFAGYSFD